MSCVFSTNYYKEYPVFHHSYMAKFKITHFKKDCISCGACAAINPDFWEMDDEGLADLKGSTEKGDHFERVIDSVEDQASNQEAADVCPVNIIHVDEIEE